jgi:hypothetical protein
MTVGRVNLGQLARRAHVKGEYFILEKDGIPVIGIMDADELEDYLAQRDSAVQARIRKSTAEFRAGKSRNASQLLAELQSEVKPAGKKRRSR